jgi:hypothetical protein
MSMIFWVVAPCSILHTARILYGATTQKIITIHISMNTSNLTFADVLYTGMTSAEKERIMQRNKVDVFHL